MHEIYSQLKGFKYLSFCGQSLDEEYFNKEDLLLKEGNGFRFPLGYNWDHMENSDAYSHLSFLHDYFMVEDSMGEE